jgi:hypothetical protein
MSHLNARERPPQPVVINSGHPGGIVRSSVVSEKDKKAGKVIIKLTNKQIINEKKKRKRIAKGAEKHSLKTIRKEYNTLKKALKKKFQRLKIQKAREQTKQLKGKANKKERDAVKSALTKRLKGLVSAMPSSAKKTYEQLSQLLRTLNKLKW